MGFYADTMHMARLWDTARDKMSGESKIQRERDRERERER